MKKTLLILAMVLATSLLTSCNKDSNNPFVGVWEKNKYHKMEFKENGEYIIYNNYFHDDPHVWLEKGSYAYNAQTSTLSLSEHTGYGYTKLAIVQSCSYDKIVYYDADDFDTYTLIRIE